MSPQRIQRKRTKGWRMPRGAIYVGRPTPWGNPFTVGQQYIWGARWDEIERVKVGCMTHLFVKGRDKPGVPLIKLDHALTIDDVLGMYKAHILETAGHRLIRDQLAGKDLCCWCALDQGCHADVLLRLAND